MSRDLLGKGFSGRQIRFLLLDAHYRETFNFTLKGLEGARSALARLDECLLKMREIEGNLTAEPEAFLLQKFQEAMDDDLNISKARGNIFEWVTEKNRLLAK